METQIKNAQKPIGQFVADDFRTAAVFYSYGIDFCCKGNRSVEEVCEKNNIDAQELLDKLEAISKNTSKNIDYNTWPLDVLALHIENKHHRYVEEKTTVLIPFLNKLCKVHGTAHPELFTITALFTASSKELASHMKKEELMLFPFIKKMVKATQTDERIDPAHFGTVKNPIASMMADHDNEGERFRQIEELTNNYTPPADACNTYKVTFAMLDEFEKDLHLHIHLENNILFPKAAALEKRLFTI
ncbi:iron-sulfur cluster repair di-iron protein [Bizionia gelidisalsuginis]|uniref:Iron-sulfur cluster repair di-iron protein n=2 Tax=Bizionia TaxID=283785 RepID=A0A8H2LFE6_9FLAO|nr:MULTISPECIES: iron-sulfur cluster repair di-iron protein [Bizionia]TYB70518.1 iron-sulfur cluster repair di-iron protein [Bizionia saleffrena]TYC10666.1 iron-sulfur cluster repair di-iron protein [Bizionia gelidisalsuginis]